MLDLHHLLVVALDLVPVCEDPGSLAFGLVVVEVAFEVSAVGEDPLSAQEGAFFPLAEHFHAGLEEDESALALLEALVPQPRVEILVRVGEDSLSLSLSMSPVAIIRTLILVGGLSNAVPVILLPVSFIHVSILIRVLALALPQAFIELPLIRFSVRVRGQAFSSEVPRGFP